MTIDEFKKYMRTTFQRPYLSTIYDEANDSIPEMIYYLLEHIAKLEENNIKIEGNFSIMPTGGDDTEALQEMLDNGYDLISPPEQTYILSHPLYLKYDGQIVDFNHSTIEFTQDQTNPHTTGTVRTNHIGILNIRSTDYRDTVNVTSANINEGVLTLSDVGGVKVGDYLHMSIGCYGTVYNEEWLSPKLRALVKVLNVNTETNEIHIDYSCGSYNIPSSDFSGDVKIVKPLDGCKIKNVKLIDKTPLRNNWVTSTSSTYPTEDSHFACCGIGLANATHVEIDNIYHENGIFTTIHSTCVSHSTIKNIETYKPRLYGKGEGYCIQNISGFDIEIENLKGYRTRHTIDFSGGGYYRCKNIQSVQSWSSDLQFHGSYEHNIVIDGFRGDGQGHEFPFFNAGSGTEFGQASADVIIKNSQLRIIPSTGTYIKDLVYDNCMLSMHRLTNQVKCTNCQIELSEMAMKVPVKRGQKTYIQWINCDVNLSANNTIGLYDEVLITNCKIHNQTITDSEIGLWLAQCGDTLISNNVINACLWLSNDNTKYGVRQTTHTITGNLFHCYRYGGIFFKDFSKSNVMATIVGNQFYTSRLYTSGTHNPYWIDFDGNSRTDSILYVNLVGNVAPQKQNFTSGVSANPNATINQTGNIE